MLTRIVYTWLCALAITMLAGAQSRALAAVPAHPHNAPTNRCDTSATNTQLTPDVPHTTERQWLWGAGSASLLDTYLSPLTYHGTNLVVLNRTERLAHWGRGHVTVAGLYSVHGAYAQSPTDEGKYLDTEFTASGGWHYNWHPTRHWRLAAGGLLEGSGGFTYNTRNGNNPAQGRLGLALCASGLAEYHFELFKKPALARVQVDAQMMGVQFAPEYGQSYYEIFSLGHSSGIIHFTHPGNCPTARLLSEVVLPVKRARITLGYLADVRQSKLGGLKRHAWRHTFMIGYTRKLVRL